MAPVRGAGLARAQVRFSVWRAMGLTCSGDAMTNSPTITGPTSHPLPRRWYTVADVAAVLQFGRSKTKLLIATGAIRSVKVGGNRRVLPERVDDYVARIVSRDQS